GSVGNYVCLVVRGLVRRFLVAARIVALADGRANHLLSCRVNSDASGFHASHPLAQGLNGEDGVDMSESGSLEVDGSDLHQVCKRVLGVPSISKPPSPPVNTIILINLTNRIVILLPSFFF